MVWQIFAYNDVIISGLVFPTCVGNTRPCNIAMGKFFFFKNYFTKPIFIILALLVTPEALSKPFKPKI